MTADQILEMAELIHRTEEPITGITAYPYAPEKDGTIKWEVSIYGLTSDGDPNGLIIQEAV